MIANVLKNWKTSLLGVATGAGIAFLSSVQGGMRPKERQAGLRGSVPHLPYVRTLRTSVRTEVRNPYNRREG